MRVLVTGATGFLGSHIARALLATSHEVRALVRDPKKAARAFGEAATERLEIAPGDMTDGAAVASALVGCNAVIHCAALIALERRHAGKVLAANVAGVERVVGKAAELGIERIVHVSSAVALFQPGASAITIDSPIGNGDSAYMRSKAECERYVRALQARGAPIRVTYPGGIFGPDDPGLSESNRGLLTLFRDAPVVTSGGLQFVDVRDLAHAHLCILGAPPGPGRHMLGGHFLPWAALIDLFEELTRRRFRRLPVPGALLRASGVVADAIKRVWDFELPLSHEAARIMTQWAPARPDPGDRDLGISFRDPRETLRDTLLWMSAAGHLAPHRLGTLEPPPESHLRSRDEQHRIAGGSHVVR